MELAILFVVLIAILAIWDYFYPDPVNPQREPKPKPKPKPRPQPTSRKQPLNLPTIPSWLDEPNPITYSQQFCSAETKAEYLTSPEWYKLKQQRLLIANHTCESTNCRATTGLHLHHVTYERLLNERIDDLRIICSSCHTKIHNRLGYDRTTLFPIN